MVIITCEYGCIYDFSGEQMITGRKGIRTEKAFVGIY